ncbi:hypothetical protein F4804DRAFT_338530 [Jackrogersella minutella]|nr:hypothetical protein F4804DRAFT_338530 [Jackrogersella minutella]
MGNHVLRIDVLVGQLRGRIKELAILQARINEDMEMFVWDTQRARVFFHGIRARYLDILGMSVRQLRDAMSISDLPIPTDQFEVEEIMKRAKPLSPQYLTRLVHAGKITMTDMDCILAGNYDSVEEFFEDIRKNSSFGVKTIPGESPALSGLRPNANQPETYDENGFYVTRDQGHNTDPNKPSASTSTAGPSTWEGTTAPQSPSQSQQFSWAGGVENGLPGSEPARPTIQLPPTFGTRSLPSPPQEEEYEDADSMIAEARDSDQSTSDRSSPFDYESDYDEDDDEMEQGEHGEPETSDMSCSDDTTEEEDGVSASIPYLKFGRLPDGDEVLGAWLDEHEMWFWQYEVLFAITLTAQRFQQEFVSARDAYKATPAAQTINDAL